MARAVKVVAPAKVNLFLGVGARRDDGYHDVVTVLHALELADSVTVTPAEELSLTASPDLAVPAERNLAWLAAQRLGDALERPEIAKVAIDLQKLIPAGAGLGGGSSDAAAVLAALCCLHGVDPSAPAVTATAASLGADVPFFLAGPAALMEGRGDVLVRTLPPVSVPVVLIKPSEPVPTAEAYRAFDAAPSAAGDPQSLLDALERGELDPAAIANNLAATAVALVPESGDALAWAMSQAGVLCATVSGSGSAIFAVCADGDSAARLADEARERGWWSAATRTSLEGMRVTEIGSDR